MVQGIGPSPSKPVISTLELKALALPLAMTLTPLTEEFGKIPGGPPPTGTWGVGPAGAALTTTPMEQIEAMKNKSLHGGMKNEFRFMGEPIDWVYLFAVKTCVQFVPKERRGKPNYNTKCLCQLRMLKFQPALQKPLADNHIVWHYLAVR
jgi:hypothetical protein